MPSYKAALAEAHLHAGGTTSARALLDELASSSFVFTEDSAWFDGVGSCARVAWELGLADHAARLFELLLPHSDQTPRNGLILQPTVAQHLGALAALLAPYDEAEAHFVQAREITERGRIKTFNADNNLWWGQMLLQRGRPGDTERARDLLEKARSASTQNGYGRIERLAAEALHMSG